LLDVRDSFFLQGVKRLELTRMLIDQFHELVVHGIGSSSRSLGDCLCNTVSKMISHQLPADGTQCLLSGGDLDHDVRTIAIFVDHFLQASDLALKSSQPTKVRRFCRWVNRHCALSIVRRELCGCTATGCNYVERLGRLIPPDVILLCHIPLPRIIYQGGVLSVGICERELGRQGEALQST
jgi:hypothetical protein